MAIKTSKSAEGYFAKYKTSGKEASNRLKKLERQLKLQPGNEKQILLAIKNIHHRRKTPVTPIWSASTRRTAQLIKEFTGKYDKQIYATDPKVSDAALKVRNNDKFAKYLLPKESKNSMFSMAQRARVVQWT